MTDVQSRIAVVRLPTAAYDAFRWPLGVVRFRIASFLPALAVFPFLVVSPQSVAEADVRRGGLTPVETLTRGGGLLPCAVVLIPVHDTLVRAPADVGIRAPEGAAYDATCVDVGPPVNGDGGLPRGKNRNLVKTGNGAEDN